MPTVCTYLALIALGFAGWVTNAIWTFKQDTTVDLILGVVGIFAAPIGVIHGIWLWF